MKFIENLVERGIFGSRWLLAPIYLGMVVAQGAYTWKFILELWHLLHDMPNMDHTMFLQGVLTLIDFLMVANLIVMVVIGGYATFVSKLDLDEHADRPAWLDHIDPGTLKTKLAGALIGVSGIHLLQTFTTLSKGAEITNYQSVMWQVIIHLTFVISTIFLAWADLLLEKKLVMAHHEGIDDRPA
jgi:uncharacterized protein (TIGR00645 family)